ncbi:GntR family transcriptional regulator [Variovorax sp. RHLX14]|uniref:GntR family transcriptional regulator n=1 Tax=Variovorax sp. RHLX14 TaxID=1259731 RepID=UPI003F44989B
MRTPHKPRRSHELPNAAATAQLQSRLRLEDHISEPYYLQLQRQIKALVQSGELPAGSSMPSERHLADALKVSRATVKRTYDELRSAQLLLSKGSRGGTAVNGTPYVSPVLRELKGFTDEMRELGLTPSSRVLERTVGVDRRVALACSKPLTTNFLRLVRLRLADGTPMSREVAWYDLTLAPALEEWQGEGSAYAFLREHCGIVLSWADQSVEAVTSSEIETAMFTFAAPGPCLLLKRMSYTEAKQLVEYAEGTFRGDAYRYRLRLQS